MLDRLASLLDTKLKLLRKEGRLKGKEKVIVDILPPGEGIDTGLLFNLEKKLKEMSINHIYLVTMKGTPAEHFYARQGYQTNQRMILMTHRL